MPPIDLHRKLRDILSHTEDLPPEAGTPRGHYLFSGTGLFNLLVYVDRNFARAGTLYPGPRDRHLGRLHAMVAVHLVELFERYLKEVAAVCVDELVGYTLDTRFDKLPIRGSTLAAHVGSDTLGRALCEASTWLDTDEVNKRFKALLADPFEDGTFVLLPRGSPKSSDRARYESLELVWQLRHTIVHNVGVMTRSDAIRFGLLTRSQIAANRLLTPTRADLRYLKRFLDETVDHCDQRIGQRLGQVLTALHAADPALFVPQEVADRLTRTFAGMVQIANATGVVPPDDG